MTRSFLPLHTVLLFFASFSFLFLHPGKVGAEVLDRVIAVVNDEIITLSELEESGKEFIEKIISSAPEDKLEEATKSARERVLNQLINQKLINQEAEKARVRLSDEEFERAYEKNITAMDLSRQEWLKKLDEAGLSEETYRTNLRNQMLRDKLILYEIRSKIIITDEMINEYYTNEFTTEMEGGGYYLLQMGFTWGDSDEVRNNPDLIDADKARAEKKAKEIRQQIVDGADFRDLAKAHSDLPSASDGGDLGVFQQDELASYMRDAVLSLEAGEISPVIVTPIGYQFFKLVSKQQGTVVHQAPLYEVKEEIREKLFERRFNEEYAKWVENIKKGAYIKTMLY